MNRRDQARIARHIENLGHEDNKIGSRAERYLIEHYRDRAFEAVVAATYSDDQRTRLRAGWILGKWQDPRGFDHLMRLVDDPDGYVRYDIAMSLGNLGDHRAIPTLIDMIQVNDGEHSVDSAAAMALCRLQELAFGPLLAALPTMTPTGRQMTAAIFGSLGDKRALEPLAEMLGDPDTTLQSVARESIEEINNPDYWNA